jgi:hypothetical protein
MQITHQDEYRSLREEIMQAIQEVRRTEFWVVAGTGILYSWLIKNTGAHPPALTYWVGPAVVVTGGVRCAALFCQMRNIAVYLKRIETAAFGDDTDLPGWERFSRSYLTTLPFWMGAALWLLMLFLATSASLVLSQ